MIIYLQSSHPWMTRPLSYMRLLLIGFVNLSASIAETSFYWKSLKTLSRHFAKGPLLLRKQWLIRLFSKWIRRFIIKVWKQVRNFFLRKEPATLSVKNLREFWRFLNAKFKLINVTSPVECSKSIFFDDSNKAESFMHYFSSVCENSDDN